MPDRIFARNLDNVDLNAAQQSVSPARPRNSVKRILPQRPVRAAIVIAAFTALLYLVEFVDLVALHGSLNNDGIRPRTLSGLAEAWTCGVPKFGVTCKKSAICRQDANFGTPQGGEMCPIPAPATSKGLQMRAFLCFAKSAGDP